MKVVVTCAGKTAGWEVQLLCRTGLEFSREAVKRVGGAGAAGTRLQVRSGGESKGSGAVHWKTPTSNRRTLTAECKPTTSHSCNTGNAVMGCVELERYIKSSFCCTLRSPQCIFVSCLIITR